VSESAESAKRGWGQFGAKPAQSETTVRAAAERRSTRESTEWKEGVKLPRVLGLVVSISRRQIEEHVGELAAIVRPASRECRRILLLFAYNNRDVFVAYMLHIRLINSMILRPYISYAIFRA